MLGDEPTSEGLRKTLQGTILAAAELQRTQFGLRLSAAVCVVGAIALQMIDKRWALHWPLTCVLLLAALAAAAVRCYQARYGVYAHRAHGMLGCVLALATVLTAAYISPFSAISLLLCPLVFSFVIGPRTGRSTAVFVTASVGYFVVVVLYATRVIDVTTVPLSLPRYDLTTMIAIGATVEIAVAACFVTARQTRDVYASALSRLHQAHGEIERRGDMLDAARADLDRAVGGGRIGELTGAQVAGYEVGELIGVGGMGDVYRAWRPDAAEPVAMKVMHAMASQDAELVERFHREARVCAELTSQHIVKVLDVGWTDDERPLIAMELLRGRDLRQHLTERGRLSLQEGCRLAQEVALALDVAHCAGIVHRDIKPANIFLANPAERDATSSWKVLDFGVSQIAGGSSLTGCALIGTPRHMSPEQVRGWRLDGRSDVFSLGVLMYLVLTGELPFDSPESASALYQIVHEQPRRPSSHVDLPCAVDHVLAVALAKSRDERFATAQELARAFELVLEGDDPCAERAGELLGRRPWCDEQLPLEEDDATTVALSRESNPSVDSLGAFAPTAVQYHPGG